jgi:hypothetical protein
VYESADVDGDGLLEVRTSGEVMGRVVNTFERPAAEVIDAEVSYEDGSSDRLTGTPNHPFWVDAVRDYVPVGKLEVGTVLHVQGGGEAILVSKTWRQGEFAAERSDVGESPERSAGTVRVFDFEVEGLQNFYVRGSGSDAAGVLVHNSTKVRGSYGDLRSAKVKDGHHIGQDAGVRELPGYDRKKAPAIQLDGPSTNVGSEHYLATQAQRSGPAGTARSGTGSRGAITQRRRPSPGGRRRGTQGFRRLLLRHARPLARHSNSGSGQQEGDRMTLEHRRLIEALIDALVHGQFDAVERDGRAGRVGAEGLRRAVSEYGATLTGPEPHWVDLVDDYPLDDGTGAAYDIPLWTKEEGRSDLTLSVTITEGKPPRIEVDDLRVL